MYSSTEKIKALLGEFRIEGMMLRYSIFMPRLYNFCKSLGFERGKIMPSRAFCSDESQGYPIILITKHFGTFPFDHGRVGGIVATDRHGPHAEHGKDMVFIQASHVGYDPATKHFGTYRRMQTEAQENSSSCGKVGSILQWYSEEYQFAQENIFLERLDGEYVITIDNQLLRQDREQGLFLNLEFLVPIEDTGQPQPIKSLSTSKCYRASDKLRQTLGDNAWPKSGRMAIGAQLLPEMFRFKRPIKQDLEGQDHLERNLLAPMPWIVTSPEPLLTAAQVNSQVEFDRTFRTIIKEHGYQGKRLVYVAGLNIDISPQQDQLFPLTKFVPWAAYIQERDGSHYTLEQAELMEKLLQQSTDNPDQIDLEQAINVMQQAKEIHIEV